MFGLEKKPQGPFEFDLEQDLKKDPAKTKELLKQIEQRMQEIKGQLREGSAQEDFDQYGILLHGYAALQKVLTKVAAKKNK